jgi:hypothetical protein
MANVFKTNRETVRRILKDLGKKAYRKVSVQKLKTLHIAKSKRCCTWMRKNIKSERVRQMMFTDEKIFTTNGFFNPKNNVVWASSRLEANQEGGTFEKEKFPINVMVALGATWEGLTQPHFFVNKETLNTGSYCKLLKFYKKQGDSLLGHQDWGFQQDCASSHTSDVAQKECQKLFKFFIEKSRWPPNSRELNPLDYSIWARISSNID